MGEVIIGFGIRRLVVIGIYIGFLNGLEFGRGIVYLGFFILVVVIEIMEAS